MKGIEITEGDKILNAKKWMEYQSPLSSLSRFKEVVPDKIFAMLEQRVKEGNIKVVTIRLDAQAPNYTYWVVWLSKMGQLYKTCIFYTPPNKDDDGDLRFIE